jgi:hypothetical protein
MKVLGIEITGNNLLWIGIEGTKKEGHLFYLAANKLACPTSAENSVKNLIELRKLVAARLVSEKIELVGIVKSTIGCSVDRVKCELIVELACLDVGINSTLISPLTVAAAQKPTGILKKTGTSFEEIYNKGISVKPAYLQRAVICAWCAIP